MTVSPFDHPITSHLLGDAEAGTLFSFKSELESMLAFEAALARAEAEAGVIPAEAGEAIAAAIAGFVPDTAALADGMERDGVIVPALVAQLRGQVGQPHRDAVHFGATSQDVVDSGFAMRAKRLVDLLAGRIGALESAFGEMEKRDGAKQVMAHTRMQRAIPVTAARIISSWRMPLERHRQRLLPVRDGIGCVSLAGAAGTLDKLGAKGEAVRARLAHLLGLHVPAGIPHSERDAQAALAAWLAQLSGNLGKFGQDVALLAQNEVGTICLADGGGSSAMAHKNNPVKAEALVSLARFNATLVSGMTHSLVHEYERSGAAWTLEWMLLPQMMMASATGLRIALELTGDIAFEADRDTG